MCLQKVGQQDISATNMSTGNVSRKENVPSENLPRGNVSDFNISKSAVRTTQRPNSYNIIFTEILKFKCSCKIYGFVVLDLGYTSNKMKAQHTALDVQFAIK